MAVRYDDNDGYDREYDEFGDAYRDYEDTSADDPQSPEQGGSDAVAASLPTVGHASSPSGGIVVATTEQGLPTSIRLERSEMDKPAQTLARDILALCRLAGRRAAAARREEMIAAGVGSEALSYLNLPTTRDVLEEEARLDEDMGADEPTTWMRRA